MDNRLAAALCAVFLAAPAAAQLESLKGRDLSLPSIDIIRSRANGPDAAAPTFTPVKYKQEEGPGWQNPALGRLIPQRPPNLKEAQVTQLIDRLARYDAGRNNGKLTLTKDQITAIVVRLVQIDVNFVDTVDAKKWDGIIKATGDVMEMSYAKEKSWDKAVESGIDAAAKALKDPHTIYFNEQQLQAFMDSMKGSFVGIGASIAADPKGLKLEFIYPGSGAEAAGIKAGDIITAVDGVSIAGQSPEDIVKKLRGDEGSTLTVTVERNGQAQKPVVVTRKQVKMPTAFSKMAASGIGYVYWNQFGEDSDTVVLSHVRRLKAQGAKSVILDVRGNPGGLVDSVASIASEFLKNGQEIVSFRKQGKVVYKNITDGNGEFVDMPVAVLVDEGSASASEILAAAVQDQRKGYAVIGSRSYGKGTQQAILPGGGSDNGGLKITQTRWHRPNGGNIDAQHDPATGEKLPGTGGVMPDIEVAVPEDQARDVAQQTAYELMGRPSPKKVADPVLEKAVEVLGNATKAG